MITNDVAARNIAQNVSRLLEERGWSVRELARRTFDPHMSVVNALSGEHIPNSGLLARIAEALETTTDALIFTPVKKSRRSA